MIFECATVWSRPHNLDISPPAITCRYHTWPRQTRLQIPGIVQWVGYIPIQTLCLHLFLTKIYTKWKQIVSDYFSHSQYLQFSDLRAHTHFSSQKNYSLCHDSSDMFILRLLADTRYFAVARCTTILQLIIGDFFCHWVLRLLAQITLQKFAFLGCQDPSRLPPSQLAASTWLLVDT